MACYIISILILIERLELQNSQRCTGYYIWMNMDIWEKRNHMCKEELEGIEGEKNLFGVEK